MARNMGEDTEYLWRGVFVQHREYGDVRSVYGPYERKQDAAGMLTRMGRWHRDVVEKRIERTPVNWEPVE